MERKWKGGEWVKEANELRKAILAFLATEWSHNNSESPFLTHRITHTSETSGYFGILFTCPTCLNPCWGEAAWSAWQCLPHEQRGFWLREPFLPVQNRIQILIKCLEMPWRFPHVSTLKWYLNILRMLIMLWTWGDDSWWSLCWWYGMQLLAFGPLLDSSKSEQDSKRTLIDGTCYDFLSVQMCSYCTNCISWFQLMFSVAFAWAKVVALPVPTRLCLTFPGRLASSEM